MLLKNINSGFSIITTMDNFTHFLSLYFLLITDISFLIIVCQIYNYITCSNILFLSPMQILFNIMQKHIGKWALTSISRPP